MKRNKSYTFVDPETKKETTIWDGRYTCVCGIVIAIEENTSYVLANKRGPGCPNEVGKWNVPCGYLDEGAAELNVAREVYEETGLRFNPADFSMIGVSDTLKERNVTLRYALILRDGRKDLPPVERLAELGGEEGEVAETKWIDIRFLDKYKWAFNHDKVIAKFLMDILAYQKLYVDPNTDEPKTEDSKEETKE